MRDEDKERLPPHVRAQLENVEADWVEAEWTPVEEEAAMEAPQERAAADQWRRHVQDNQPPNEALDKWGPEIEEQMIRDIEEERWRGSHQETPPEADHEPER